MSSDFELRQRIAELESELSELRQSSALPYRSVLEDMSELVVRWKPDGTRLFVNDAYCRLFGASREAMIGTSFWPLISEVDRERVRARIQALSPEQPVSTGRHRAVGPDNEVVWMEWVDRAIYDSEQRLLELQSVGRDITHRVNFEEQARRIASGDAAARATASIAHDLSNVLQVIQGVSALLDDGAEDSFEADHLKAAVDAGNRLLTQLKQLSHGLVLQPSRVDLSERVTLLKGLLVELTHSEVSIETNLAPEPCPLLGDPTQIDQILLNLVRNAAEAMPSGGTVRIETERAAASLLPESQRPETAEACVVLRVLDNGPGISEVLLPRVFDARITTKPGGQGLGLATVKSIVQGHRGTVLAKSSPAGTSFELAFPMASPG